MDTNRIRALIAPELPSLVELRRDLHRHPELAYEERRTCDVVCRELAAIGVEHVRGLAGGTGVLAHLPATDPPPSPTLTSPAAIALRADMDALPILERTGAPYASATPGVMHACGHDGHTANLIGVARVLAKLPRPHPVTLIFQPAEEGGAGGKRMCDDGALSGALLGPPVRSIYGLHIWPQYTIGAVGTRLGPLLAATDNFVVTIRGRQAHAAYPHDARDPILAAAHVVTALQSIAARAVSPTDSAVVTVGTIAGGVARNVIPESVRITGTVRTLRDDTRALVRTRFFDVTTHTAAALGCDADIDWQEGYPATINHPDAVARFQRIAAATLGPDRVVTVEHPTMGGEDFAYYAQHIPACYFVLGNRPQGQPHAPLLHQPDFDFADDALPTGIQTMCALALDADL